VEFRTVSHEGQSFVFSQEGEGPDIVLWHGFPDTPYSWAPIAAPLLEAGWRVTIPWLRGYHADTIVPGRRYDPETLGRDALGLLDALELSRPVLFGHDWGAMLAYMGAALEPERVRAIVTSGIPHPRVLQRTPATLWSVRHFFALKMPWAEWHCKRGDYSYLEKLYTRWAPTWHGPLRNAAVENAKRALSTPETLNGAIDYYRDLPLGSDPVARRVGEVPGLIIGGDHGPGHGLYQRTADLLPSPSRALIVAHAGHWPHLENTPAVLPELFAFLASLEP
jgi:pimeloyl-ACP methyl ester carboxylesterase